MTSQHSLQAAIDRVRSFIPEKTLSKGDRIAKLNGRYIGLDRDIALEQAFESLILSVAVTDLENSGKPDKRRILAVCGESGAGKTTALFHHVSRQPAMQPYIDQDGEEVQPLLAFNAPSPCTPILLALEGISKLGYPLKKTLKEYQAWELFRTLLKTFKVMWLLIDEAQHTIDTANVNEAAKIANSLKNLVQMPDWPVRVILAGVDPLAEFVTNKQLRNRATDVPFDKIAGAVGQKTMGEVIKTIIVDHAGLKTNLDEDFVARLCHAGENDFGTMVQMVRGAAELAILADHSTVTDVEFAQCYSNFSGCLPTENIFTANDWQRLDPALALLRQRASTFEGLQASNKQAKRRRKR